MAHYAVSAIGADRPGIVAAVTEVLMDLGCNIEDSSMSILRGHFAMTLVVAAPDPVDAAALESALQRPAQALSLLVSARAIDDAAPTPFAGVRWTVSVYGADHPGIVHGVSAALAELGANIVDLTTRMVGGPDRPVYAMVLDVALAGAPGDELEARLAELSDELGVECSAHPSEADIL